MSRVHNSAFPLEKFARWASVLEASIAHKCVIALAASLEFPPQNRTAYGQGFFDALSVSPPQFPLFRDAEDIAPFLRWYTETPEDKIRDAIHLILSTQNRTDKENYAECYISVTPALSGFPIDAFYHKQGSREEGVYYSVNTICPITGETETGFFQQRRQKIQWCYTYEQLQKELERQGLSSFVPPYTKGVYASTHFQDGIGDLPTSIAHIENSIVGMYTPDIDPYVVHFKNAGKSHVEYARVLLQGGPELNRSVLQKLLVADSLKVKSVYPRTKGKCDFCKSKRKLTSTLAIGTRKYRSGSYCAQKVRLAYKFLHYRRLGLDLCDLTDQFAVLVQE